MPKIEEAQEILRELGLPKEQQNEMSAFTLLALCGIREDDSWSKTKRKSLTLRKGIMEFVNRNYRPYAENSRESFRRQVLHQFVQAGIADHNPDDPSLPTNSSRNHYALSKPVANVIRAFGTPDWQVSLSRFLKKNSTLIELYDPKRKLHCVPVRLPDGTELLLSPGKHNELQAVVVSEFASRFVPGGHLLYLGDTAKKNLVFDRSRLAKLGIPITEHDKLPDIVLYDAKRKWLFLVEVVTSHGPLSPKRMQEFRDLLSQCSAGVVYVTAFPDFACFKRYASQIAWETEVWIAENPDHMLHYNGDRFLGPR